ncbi:hypothetical protein E1B28_009376 [Marasmius oreades]|uniref:Amidohydrolase-related domain-containing protein n=1 Tax=Marasmius oreades TaxID=181124 RepID=A0A9P7S202_9AGAR|nr:uncharacterized protein E1B28_009376 [Marasmius oreades]KAG7093088.1 hypothetical protein E1B28_009376 [Marasmius oreades]
MPTISPTKCSRLRLLPSPSPDFYNKEESNRFDASLTPIKPILVRNATIWTGEVAEGLELIFGDVLLDKGIIRGVGNVKSVEGEVEEINVNGVSVTSGTIELHSHLGGFSSPSLSGLADTNSRNGLAQPWLRSVDALNAHEAYRLALAGGVTSALQVAKRFLSSFDLRPKNGLLRCYSNRHLTLLHTGDT